MDILDDEQQVFEYYYTQKALGLTRKEIAGKLGITERQLKYKLEIARRTPRFQNRRMWIWDMETLPEEHHIYTFGQGERYINHKTIEIDSHIFCISYKRLLSNKVHTISMNTDELALRRDKKWGDRRIIEEFYSVLEPGDVLIGWNGTSFDWRTFYGKVVDYNLPALSGIISLDPMREINKIARYPSKSLSYVSRRWGTSQKIDNSGMPLWISVCKGDEKAMEEMVTYCEGDLPGLEQNYLKMRSHIKGHPNMATPGTTNCVICNSADNEPTFIDPFRSGIQYLSYSCNNCGASYHSRKSEKVKPLVKK